MEVIPSLFAAEEGRREGEPEVGKAKLVRALCDARTSVRGWGASALPRISVLGAAVGRLQAWSAAGGLGRGRSGWRGGFGHGDL